MCSVPIFKLWTPVSSPGSGLGHLQLSQPNFTTATPTSTLATPSTLSHYSPTQQSKQPSPLNVSMQAQGRLGSTALSFQPPTSSLGFNFMSTPSMGSSTKEQSPSLVPSFSKVSKPLVSSNSGQPFLFTSSMVSTDSNRAALTASSSLFKFGETTNSPFSFSVPTSVVSVTNTQPHTIITTQPAPLLAQSPQQTLFPTPRGMVANRPATPTAIQPAPFTHQSTPFPACQPTTFLAHQPTPFPTSQQTHFSAGQQTPFPAPLPPNLCSHPSIFQTAPFSIRPNIPSAAAIRPSGVLPGLVAQSTPLTFDAPARAQTSPSSVVHYRPTENQFPSNVLSHQPPDASLLPGRLSAPSSPRFTPLYPQLSEPSTTFTAMNTFTPAGATFSQVGGAQGKPFLTTSSASSALTTTTTATITKPPSSLISLLSSPVTSAPQPALALTPHPKLGQLSSSTRLMPSLATTLSQKPITPFLPPPPPPPPPTLETTTTSGSQPLSFPPFSTSSPGQRSSPLNSTTDSVEAETSPVPLMATTGSDITLRVSVTETDRNTYLRELTWYHNGVKINPTSNTRLNLTSDNTSLTISSVTDSDSACGRR